MIEVNNITKHYGELIAIKDMSMNISDASIYGIVGHNGAGKTTLLKTMIGMFKPENGEILVDGENAYDNENIKQNMFFVPDELFFLPQSTITHMSKFYSGFYPRWNDEITIKLTDIFGLDIKRRISKFSKGMQRQVAIILALSSRPKYLLLDELFDGIDPVIRNIIRKLLIEVVAENNTTIVVSSHNLRELEDLCDHVGVINDKHIVYENSIDDLKNENIRYRIVFSYESNVEDFKNIKHSSINIMGQVVTFTAKENEEIVDEKLQKLNPILVEKISLGLEELFLDEMEVDDYDFSGLFD